MAKNTGNLSDFLENSGGLDTKNSKDSSEILDIQTKKTNSTASNPLTLFAEAKDKQYNTNRNNVVFLDEDIHEVLTLIKKEYKVGIHVAANYMIELFLLDNIKELKKLKSKNKFIG